MRASRRALRNVRRMSVAYEGVYLNRGSRIDRVTGLLMVTSEGRGDEGRLRGRVTLKPLDRNAYCVRERPAVRASKPDEGDGAVDLDHYARRLIVWMLDLIASLHRSDSSMLHTAAMQKVARVRRIAASLISWA